MLSLGQLSGDEFDDLKEAQKTLVMWEWLLYPVGTTVYVVTFFFFWVLRRLRRRFYESEVKRYNPECFQANRSFLEFVLDRKFAKTKQIESGKLTV